MSGPARRSIPKIAGHAYAITVPGAARMARRRRSSLDVTDVCPHAPSTPNQTAAPLSMVRRRKRRSVSPWSLTSRRSPVAYSLTNDAVGAFVDPAERLFVPVAKGAARFRIRGHRPASRSAARRPAALSQRRHRISRSCARCAASVPVYNDAFVPMSARAASPATRPGSRFRRPISERTGCDPMR